VLQYADGLPLTIKVMGSFLCGQDESEWKDAIKRLETIPLKKTMEVLELSYNGLEEDCKQIFLDVACILKGWEKEEAIRVLESRGFRARIGLRVLKQKSLITYEDGELEMHDHLKEMGRNIGTPATKCLKLWSPGFEIAIKGLAKMKDLKVLHIRVSDKCDINWKFDKVREYLPSSLRFMKWWYFPFSSLPNTFRGNHLVRLEQENSKIVQLWEDGDEKVINNLRFFTIKHSKLRTFDLRLAPNLEQLTIEYCHDFLTKLHLGNAPNLKTLEFEGCYNLEEFQIPSESLKLEHLAVRYLNLTNLHLGNTPNLKNLTLSYSKLKTIHLGSTPNLETLELKGCNDLVELKMPAESRLLEGCNDLVQLEMPSECLKIEELNLSHSKFRTLDLGLTPNLKSLHLENFYDLVEINAQVGYLKKLAFLYLSGCGRFENFVFDKRSQPATEAGSLSELHLIAIAEPNTTLGRRDFTRSTPGPLICCYVLRLNQNQLTTALISTDPQDHKNDVQSNKLNAKEVKRTIVLVVLRISRNQCHCPVYRVEMGRAAVSYRRPITEDIWFDIRRIVSIGLKVIQTVYRIQGDDSIFKGVSKSPTNQAE
ncbi:Toll/interleukin-1 receptor domain-containing protein, partial [Tanacetum coccineum]